MDQRGALNEYPTRFMREIGVRAYLRIYWGGLQTVSPVDCPNCYGRGSVGCHNAETFLAEVTTGYDDKLGGEVADHPDDRWPTKCDHCDAVVPHLDQVLCDCGCGQMRDPPGSPHRQIHRRTLYQAPDGTLRTESELQPGDMYLATWHRCVGQVCIHGWTNCDGKHLVVIVPEHHPWDVNGRASNCALPEDTLHRCWVLEGNPETDPISVGKNGLTCNAGGGSIQVPGFHGVLSGGVLRQC